jgi:hypothetical protein
MSADMVRAVLASLGEGDLAGFDAAMTAASTDEQLAAAVVLARTARPTRPLATATYRDLAALEHDARRKANGLQYLRTHFADWASWPHTPLSHWLKVASPAEVAELRAVLRNAGLELDT